jgi:hypothetical protein
MKTRYRVCGCRMHDNFHIDGVLNMISPEIRMHVIHRFLPVLLQHIKILSSHRAVHPIKQVCSLLCDKISHFKRGFHSSMIH